ncbi:MAG: DUF2179 domain-containing protein [Planctomycetes bacterium]|nr:DUF2179 domain-containing protein [Planctomycetota bacterium]
MEFAWDWPIVQSALMILVLRVIDVSIDTLRVIAVFRGRQVLASGFGFVSAFIFIMVVATVLKPPLALAQMLGYACGFAAGNFVGMQIADRFATAYLLLRVFSRRHGHEICARLRDAGHAVTLISGEGRDGVVPILFSLVKRQTGPGVIELVRSIDDKAFVVSEPIDRALGGFVAPSMPNRGWLSFGPRT